MQASLLQLVFGFMLECCSLDGIWNLFGGGEFTTSFMCHTLNVHTLFSQLFIVTNLCKLKFFVISVSFLLHSIAYAIVSIYKLPPYPSIHPPSQSYRQLNTRQETERAPPVADRI